MKKLLYSLLVTLIIICLLPTLSALGADTAPEIEYFGRSLLSGNSAYVYDVLTNTVFDDTLPSQIELDESRGITASELSRGVDAFISDRPDAFWFSGSYTYSMLGDAIVGITPTYSHTGQALKDAKQALDAQINEIMKKLPDTDNYDKALYLHNALAAHTDYVKVGEHQTAYGALVNKKAVCAGYAAAYQLLMQRAGISTWTVEGNSINSRTGQTVAHAWNLVWLDEGVCVYTDVTWDDQGEELYHTYFNMSLADFSDTHFPEDPSLLPSCTHSGYDLITIRGLRIDLDAKDSVGALIEKLSPTSSDVYTATFACDESKLSEWLSSNAAEISTALGANGSYSYTYNNLGDEVHLTFSLKPSTNDLPANDTTPTLSGCGLTVAGSSALVIALAFLLSGILLLKKRTQDE